MSGTSSLIRFCNYTQLTKLGLLVRDNNKKSKMSTTCLPDLLNGFPCTRYTLKCRLVKLGSQV